MPRRPRALRGAAALAALALGLTACSTSSDSTGNGVELQMLLFGGPEEQAAYQRVADGYRQIHPEVTVQIQVVAKQDDLLARLTSAFAAGSPPDLFLINFRKYGLYAEQGVLAEVQQFLDDNNRSNTEQQTDVITLDLADFFEAPLAAFRFDGTNQTCLPQNVSSLVTYVNRDLFEAAGITPPAGDWDWEAFKTAAGHIAETLGPDQFAIGSSPSLIRLAPMVWSNGGDVVDDEITPTALTLDTSEAREALGFFASLVPEQLAPDDVQEQARDSEARFIDGNLAMFWSSRREVPGFRADIPEPAAGGFDWDVVPFPIAPGGERVTMLHSDAFCLAEGEHAQRAWEFVEYALSAEGGAPILAESGRTVPSNKTVATSPAFLRDDLPPANNQVFLDNAEIARATPSTATWNEVENQADDILEELFYGRMTIDQALARFAAIQFR